MKKILCLILIVLLAVSVNVFSNKQVEELFVNNENIKSIKVIVDANYEKIDGIYNGNLKIVNLNDFKVIHTISCKGITLILNKNNFNLEEIIDNCNINIVRKYYIYDNVVYDCKIIKYKIMGFKTMQIVVNKNDIIIGFPMILNSF